MELVYCSGSSANKYGLVMKSVDPVLPVNLRMNVNVPPTGFSATSLLMTLTRALGVHGQVYV